ncbi:hypothetical protein JXE04_03365 [Patescibacteria group bacterium]|nr:hypothetical protein [Patescibacteria group bacterium]
MKKILAILFIILGLNIQAQIKTAVYWTASTMTENMVNILVRDSLLIIDIENFNNNPEQIEKIKKLNPRVIILFYINPMEMWDKEIANRNLGNKLQAETPSQFILKKTNGSPLIFWQNMHMMNMTMHCPKVNNQRYIDFYVDWLNRELAKMLKVNGIFIDNGTSTISWMDTKIDADNDGRADLPNALDISWCSGMIEFLSLLEKDKPKDFIIVTNKAEKSLFFKNDGVMFEKFPNNYLGDTIADGWYRCMELAEKAGKFTIFQCEPKNIEFVIASSLLLDNIYVCMGQNRSVPSEYLLNVGKPLGRYYEKDALQCRDYENYRIEVNPKKQTAKFIKTDKD